MDSIDQTGRSGNKEGKKAPIYNLYNPFHCFPSLLILPAKGDDSAGREGDAVMENSSEEGMFIDVGSNGGRPEGFEYRNRVPRGISRKRKGRRLKQFSHGLEW